MKIQCIEIPCPKRGRPYKSGWEHVEFAIGDASHSATDRFKKKQEKLLWPYQSGWDHVKLAIGDASHSATDRFKKTKSASAMSLTRRPRQVAR
jgi:predicted metalloenzyme YecM